MHPSQADMGLSSLVFSSLVSHWLLGPGAGGNTQGQRTHIPCRLTGLDLAERLSHAAVVLCKALHRTQAYFLGLIPATADATKELYTFLRLNCTGRRFPPPAGRAPDPARHDQSRDNLETATH